MASVNLTWIKKASELAPHIKELIQLDQSCLSGEAWDANLWPAFFSKRKALALKVEGGFILFHLTLDEAEVMKLAVAPDQRRKGIAKGLFHAALPVLEAEKIEKIFLEVREGNKAARGLYEALGFTVIGKRKDYYKKPIENAITYQYIVNQTCNNEKQA